MFGSYPYAAEMDDLAIEEQSSPTGQLRNRLGYGQRSDRRAPASSRFGMSGVRGTEDGDENLRRPDLRADRDSRSTANRQRGARGCRIYFLLNSLTILNSDKFTFLEAAMIVARVLVKIYHDIY